MRRVSVAVLVSMLCVVGCGSSSVRVPNNEMNGPINAVGSPRSAGFAVHAVVNGHTVSLALVRDVTANGQRCRVMRQDPHDGTLASGGVVVVEVRCR
jgi:hypothetical protein